MCLNISDRHQNPHIPWFAETAVNMTVAEGRTASLPCVVENLGNYRVRQIFIVCVFQHQNYVIDRGNRTTRSIAHPTQGIFLIEFGAQSNFWLNLQSLT